MQVAHLQPYNGVYVHVRVTLFAPGLRQPIAVLHVYGTLFLTEERNGVARCYVEQQYRGHERSATTWFMSTSVVRADKNDERWPLLVVELT